MAATSNGGKSWRQLGDISAPFYWGLSASVPGGVSEVKFATRQVGYLYNPGLEVSDDGGLTWMDGKLKSVAQLVISGGSAYALTGSARPALWRARIGRLNWARAPLPGDGTNFELVAGSGVLVLLEASPGEASYPPSSGGQVWVASNGGWAKVAVPCRAQVDGSVGAVAVAYGEPASWALDCELDDQSSQALHVLHRVFISRDAGRTWALAGDAPSRGVDYALAWNGLAGLCLATESAGDALAVSTDTGRHWRLALGAGDFFGWANLGFVSPGTAYVVEPSHYGYSAHPDKLYRTSDGGKSWSALPVPPQVVPSEAVTIGRSPAAGAVPAL